MPTYQYECGSCGHSFEQMQAISERKLTTCPQCGKEDLHRLIGSGGGLIFKGSGFYETDYKRPATAPACPAADGKKSCPCPCDGGK